MARMEWSKLLSRERLVNKDTNPEAYNAIQESDRIMSPFLKDYYTIISSSHFRRLQDKTQVFTMEENDSVRNRLTHSLEVSSICEILGKEVAKRIKSERPNEIASYNGDFSEDLSTVLRCAGLLHDIGNPPFGHSGEKYIQIIFANCFKAGKNELIRKRLSEQMIDDLKNFEGNAQNLRIATTIGSSSFADIRNYGMALTSAVLSAIVKYPYSSVGRPNKSKSGKIGYYYSEEWKYERIAKNTGTLDKKESNNPKRSSDGLAHPVGYRNPIMLLMEAADDIAYGTADIEDFYSLGLISFDTIQKHLPKEMRIHKSKFKSEADILRAELLKVREQCIDEVVDTFMEYYDRIMTSQPLTVVYKNNEKKEITELTYFCTVIFEGLEDERDSIYAFRDQKNEKINHAKENISTLLKDLTNSRKNNQNRRTFRDVVIYSELKQYYEKSQMEANLKINKRKDVREDGLKWYFKARAVNDFVSGMTDHYVSEFLDKINNVDNLESRVIDDLITRLSDVTYMCPKESFISATRIINEFTNDYDFAPFGDAAIVERNNMHKEKLLDFLLDTKSKLLEKQKDAFEAGKKDEMDNSLVIADYDDATYNLLALFE